MATICPTITAKSIPEYTLQLNEIASFVERVHIDVADGVFAPNKLIAIKDIWWPAGVVADIHVMYQAVMPYIDELISHKPHMVIMHAEASGNFFELARRLQKHDIKVGIALLAETPVSLIEPALSVLDHVLLFSGDLGYFGGHAKMSLLSKIRDIKKINNRIEIGWDGGINQDNIKKLLIGGVDVFNVGGAIHNSKNPIKAYATLKALAKQVQK